MATDNNNVYGGNWADLTLDLSGKNHLVLEFFAKVFDNEANSLPASYTDYANGDGVSISADGVTWYRVMNLTGSNNVDSYMRYAVDLDAALASAGISYTAAFMIRFQQYDRYGIPGTGICYDDIRVYPQ
jgi:hypothetical protein